MTIFKGCGTAIVTPFNEDLSVDYETFKNLIDFQIDNHTDALIILGTTGESATIDEEEYESIIKFAVEYIDGRCPVIAGSGTNSTLRTIKLSNIAKKHHVDALLVVTPYYNKGNERGMYEHYKTIHDEVNLPIILYNVPSRTGCHLSLSNVVKLSQLKNIVGIKDASGDLSYAKEIISNTGASFALYSGNDNLTIDIVKLGGTGVISVIANIMPLEMNKMCQCALNYQLSKANDLWLLMSDLDELMYIEVNPIPVKKALHLMGYNTQKLRLPLTELNEKFVKQLNTALLSAKLVKE